MQKVLFVVFALSYAISLHAQCTIDPFIQQNYELDAQLLVLKEMRSDPNDPDYNNPFVSQSRVDGYLEKLSAIYQNQDNLPQIDSLFNEFQFHVNQFFIVRKRIEFAVDTNVSWVQSLKDTGNTNVSSIDDFLNLYQFGVNEFEDHTDGTYAGKTIFMIESDIVAINIFPLRNDLVNTSPTEIELLNVIGYYYDTPCNYTGVTYQIPDYDQLIPVYRDVTTCDISFRDDIFTFALRTSCLGYSGTQQRYLTVSNDCNTVTFARTLSNDEFEIFNVNMYPNPVDNVLHVQGIDHIENVEVYSITGNKIDVSLQENTKVNVNNLAKGVYFLKITDEQNRSILKKFIKN